ncbi:glycosyltransferase family 2 protein [Patescibacteria group bacterium]|nr:glycosyltransferase family 2 protein [Patescibacteria group bacterium]MBU1473190.1 glycosyltransferase family 2 protein [Patescibacteria group bacterium]MBU2459760.1 glycosyltransferase family 2 protein [Patescibacteria group bacterium]MBU2544272.1 glycosyltransferase family 2 protein [Patescibacteria group bacterium]
MEKSPDLSVVILNFNTRDLTRKCLVSIYASNMGEYRMEVIICDNGSTDGSLESIKKEFPDALLIENGKNLGFAAGNNPGIKSAKGRNILLLNSDTEVQPDTFRIMIDHMDGNPKIGASTCKLILADGTMDPACHRGFPSPWAALTYFSGLEKLFSKSRIFGQYHQGYKDLNTIHEVDMISGAFFLARRKAVIEVGPLDEEYFFYGEDMDWCFRMKEKGWKIMFNPTAYTIHLKKKSGRANTDRTRRIKTEIFFFQYNKLFYQKNYERYYPQIVMRCIYFLFDLRIFLLKHFSL